MSTLDAINAEKQSQLDVLDAQLLAAGTWENEGVPGMAAKIAALEAQRLALDEQAYNDAMDSPALAAALAKMKAATQAMNATAAQMTSATAFLTHVDDLIGGAKQAEAALKGAAA